MAKIANTSLANTFNVWRINTNQIATRLNQFAINESALYANTVTANVTFVSLGSTRLGTGANTTIVNGILNANGRVTVSKNINVSGNTTTNKLVVTNSLTSSGNTTLSGTTTVGVNLVVSGNTTTNKLVVTNSLTSSGNTNLGNGAADITTVTGSASVSENLTVTGNTTTSKVVVSTNGIHFTKGAAPTTAVNTAAIFVKATGGQPELFFREENNGDEVQITANGALNIAAGGDVSGPAVAVDGDAVLFDSTTGKLIKSANAKPLLVGIHSIWVPAAAMKPTVSNGCATLASTETTSGRPDMNTLDFDDAADEHAQFDVAFPKSWNKGTITFRVHHTTTATDTDGVAWGLQGVAVGDSDTIDVAYGTAVVVTDTYQSTAEDEYVTDVSAALTIAGTPANSDRVIFRIFRDVSDAADTAVEDARLLGVTILFTVDASTDA